MTRLGAAALAAAALLTGPPLPAIAEVGAAEGSEAPLRLVTGEWPPYTGRGAEGGGALARLVRLALDEMDRTGEIESLPFALAYRRAREGGEGGVAMAFPFFRDARREEEMHYSAPLAEVEIVLFHRRGAPPPAGSDLRALRGRRFGLVEGYAYRDEVQELASAHEGSRRYTTELQAFAALMNEEVDVVPAAHHVGRHILTDAFGLAGHAVEPLAGEAFRWTRTVHLLVPRTHPQAAELVAAFDAALARLRARGVPAALLAEALGPDTGPVANLVVQLTGSDSFPVIVGFPEADRRDRGVLIPKGTRAVVEDWSPRFREPGPVEVSEAMYERSRVTILEGPLEGRSLWVYNLYIEVDHGE